MQNGPYPQNFGRKDVYKNKVEETGHFQNFVARTVGTIKIDAVGTYTLNVRPVKMAAGAVMDLRMVVLTRNPE